MKKKIFNVLAVTAIAVSGVALASCGNTPLEPIASTTTTTTDASTTTDDVPKITADELIKQLIVDVNGTRVQSNFTLPSYLSDGETNYPLTWTSKNEELLKFEYGKDLEDVTAVIVRPEETTEVKFTASVTVDGKTATTEELAVRIFRKLNAEEQFKYNYDNASSKPTADITGYVLRKGGYIESSKQCCLYVACDDYEAGAYYLYNVSMEKDAYTALKVGEKISCTGNTVSAYNGTIEACYGEVKVLKDEAGNTITMSAEDLAAKTLNITDDIVAGNSVLYKQAHEVVLNQARVISIAKEQTKTAGKYLSTLQTVITCDVNGTSFVVSFMQGLTAFDDAATATLWKAVTEKVKVGDYINITGVLVTNSNISIDEAKDIVVAEDKPDWGYAAEAIEAVETFKNVVENKEIQLPSTITVNEKEVAVQWELDVCTSIELTEENKLVITPGLKKENILLIGYFTYKDFTLAYNYEFCTILLDKQEQVEWEKDDLDVKITEVGEYELPTAGKTVDTVEISWEIAGTDEEKAAVADFISLDGNVFTVGDLDEDITFKLKATIVVDKGLDTEASTTATLTFKVANAKVKDYSTPKTATAYKPYIVQAKVNKTLYLTGAMSSYYLATTNNIKNSVELYVEEVKKDEKVVGYNVFYNYEDETTKTTKKKYLIGYENDGHINVEWVDDEPKKGETTAAPWNFVEGHMEVVINDTAYVLSTNGSYETGSLKAVSQLSSLYPVIWDEFVENVYTREEKVDYELDRLALVNSVASYGTVVLPQATRFDGVKITYELKKENAILKEQTDTALKFGCADTEDIDIVVVATIECNGVKKTKEFPITVKVVNYLSVTAAIKAAKDGEQIAITGYVTSINTSSNYCWISDGESDFEVYGAVVTGSNFDYATIKKGQIISVIGTYTLFGTTHETVKNTASIVKCVDATDAQKTAYTATELSFPTLYEAKTEVALTGKGSLYNTTTITWEAPEGAAIVITTNAETGKQTYAVTPVVEGADVELTATIKFGESEITKKFTVHVASDEERAKYFAEIVKKAVPTVNQDENVAIDLAKLAPGCTVSVTYDDNEIVSYAEGKLNFVAGTATATQKISITVTVGDYTTDPAEVTVQTGPAAVLDSYTLNQKVMGYTGTTIGYGTNVIYKVDGIKYSLTDVAFYGNGLQIKKTTGVFYNTVAFGRDLKTITLTFGSSTGGGTKAGTARAENLVVEVSATGDFTDAKTLTAGTAKDGVVAYEVPAGYTYYRITNTSTYAVYLNTIVVDLVAA